MVIRICVIGAGPAGLMAAIHAAQAGTATTVLEANPDAGRKLLLTGGGRCNFTHVASPEEFVRAFGKAGRVLRHSLYELSSEDTIAFFRRRGLTSRVESDGSVFPATDRATDVRDVLVREAQRLGVRVLHRSRVTNVTPDGNGFMVRTERQQNRATHVVIATGGLTWPQTGSTGDGYRLAAELGHTVVPPRPSLVPLLTRETWVGELAGVSVPNVSIRAIVNGRKCTASGDMLFTQGGIGGPAAQDMSRHVTDSLPNYDEGIRLGIDLAAGLTAETLAMQMQDRRTEYPKKTVANILAEFVPRRLSRTLCHLGACDPDLPVGLLRKESRKRLVALVKKLPLCAVDTEPMAKATVTRGGISVREIHPQTMESKLRPGLFFAGEVIDVDGPCGGYNLQMCWSTGALAGRSAVRSLPDANAPAT